MYFCQNTSGWIYLFLKKEAAGNRHYPLSSGITEVHSSPITSFSLLYFPLFKNMTKGRIQKKGELLNMKIFSKISFSLLVLHFR